MEKFFDINMLWIYNIYDYKLSTKTYKFSDARRIIRDNHETYNIGSRRRYLYAVEEAIFRRGKDIKGYNKHLSQKLTRQYGWEKRGGTPLENIQMRQIENNAE